MSLSSATRTRIAAAAATAAAMVVGTIATNPDSAWYRHLKQPKWEPPGWAFPVVWTPLYTAIGYAGGQALVSEEDPARRRALAISFGANLVVNAGFCVAFFRGKSVAGGLATQGVLNVLNADLIRRAWAADPKAGAALVPYAAWTVFASTLNAALLKLNR